MHVGLGLGLTRGQGGGVFSPHHLYQSGDILLWYDPSDLTTMFKDTAGTQPVTADGDSVALMLDKGQWGGKTLSQVLADQAELTANGDFSNGLTGYSAAGNVPASVSAGILTLGPPVTSGGRYQDVTIPAGATVEVSITARRVSGSAGLLLSAWVGGAFTSKLAEVSVTNASFAETVFRVSPGGTSLRIYLNANTGGSAVMEVQRVSVKEIPGYHRVQATGTSMPKYKTGPNPAAAENSPELVTNGTFDSDVSGWTAIGTDGGTDTTFSWNASGYMNVTRGVGGITGRPEQGFTTIAGRSYRLSVSAKSAQRFFFTLGTTSGGNNILGTTIVSGNTTNLRTFTATSTTTYINFWTDNSATAVIDDVSVKEIPASAPYIHWLLYDGTDDGHATGTITWGTDEVAICAGVTKSSDAAAGAFAEFSASSSSNNGSFALLAPSSAAANYFWRTKGTAASDQTRTTYAAPTTDVLTGMGKIATDSNRFRIDSDEATAATDQGTGNFGSYVMYFGRRGGTSNPFNGREYQTVIRSRLLSAAELASLETFIAGKTGVIL